MKRSAMSSPRLHAGQCMTPAVRRGAQPLTSNKKQCDMVYETVDDYQYQQKCTFTTTNLQSTNPRTSSASGLSSTAPPSSSLNIFSYASTPRIEDLNSYAVGIAPSDHLVYEKLYL